MAKNGEELTAYFKYAQPIRKIIYTTNTVEGFNRQLRKITKSKAVFPNEDALLKLIWLVSQNILKKWTLTTQQLYIHFLDRFEIVLRWEMIHRSRINSSKKPLFFEGFSDELILFFNFDTVY